MEDRKSRIKIGDFINKTRGIEFLLGKIVDLTTSVARKDTRSTLNYVASYDDISKLVGKKYRIDLTPYNHLVCGILANAYSQEVINPDRNNDLSKDKDTLFLEAEAAYGVGNLFEAARKADLIFVKYSSSENEDPRLEPLFRKIMSSLDSFS